MVPGLNHFWIKAKGKDLSELLEDPTLRRSKRMIKQKMGTKRNIAPREIVLGAQWCLHQSVLQSSRILVLLFVMWKKANSPCLHSAKKMIHVPVGQKSSKKKPPAKDEADDKQNKKSRQ